MSLRRSTLTLVTASAVALSVFTPVAQAQSSDALTQLSDNITSSQILDDDGNPVDGNETWPGSSEGSSMLSSGDIPAAPSLSSSGKDRMACHSFCGTAGIARNHHSCVHRSILLGDRRPIVQADSA